MAKLLPNRQLNARMWIQEDGPFPGKKPRYLSTGYAGAYSPPVSGTAAVVRPDPERYGRYKTVGRTAEAPDQGTLNFQQDLTQSALDEFEQMLEDGATVAVHLLMGNSGDLANNPHAWNTKIVIPSADLSALALNDIQSTDADDVHMWAGELSFETAHRVTRGTWNEVGGATITAPVNGGVYGKNRKIIFAAMQEDTVTSPGLSGGVLKSINGGESFTLTTLNGLALNNPGKMAYVYGSVFFLSTTDNGYWWADEDYTQSSDWSKVTSGFVATKTPNHPYVANGGASFICANGGYIYRLDSVGNAVTPVQAGDLTTSNLNWIDGIGDTVVAVGASNAVLVSQNLGSTFSLKTGPAVGIALNTVSVVDEDTFLVGAANGRWYYTRNGGDSWVEGSLAGAGTGSVSVIRMYKENPAFGILVHDNGTSRIAYRTTDGANTWEYRSLDGFKTAVTSISDIAIYDPNTIAAFGVNATATDGFVAVAKGERFING